MPGSVYMNIDHGLVEMVLGGGGDYRMRTALQDIEALENDTRICFELELSKLKGVLSSIVDHNGKLVIEIEHDECVLLNAVYSDTQDMLRFANPTMFERKALTNNDFSSFYTFTTTVQRLADIVDEIVMNCNESENLILIPPIYNEHKTMMNVIQTTSCDRNTYSCHVCLENPGILPYPHPHAHGQSVSCKTMHKLLGLIPRSEILSILFKGGNHPLVLKPSSGGEFVLSTRTVDYATLDYITIRELPIQDYWHDNSYLDIFDANSVVAASTGSYRTPRRFSATGPRKSLRLSFSSQVLEKFEHVASPTGPPGIASINRRPVLNRTPDDDNVLSLAMNDTPLLEIQSISIKRRRSLDAMSGRRGDSIENIPPTICARRKPRVSLCDVDDPTLLGKRDHSKFKCADEWHREQDRRMEESASPLPAEEFS